MKVKTVDLNQSPSKLSAKLGIKYTELDRTLNQLLSVDPTTSFIGQASGNSMEGVGIFDGDILIIDRMIEPKNLDVIVANYNHEFVCKIIDIENRLLLSASENYPAVKINSGDTFQLEGIVTSAIHLYRKNKNLPI